LGHVAQPTVKLRPYWGFGSGRYRATVGQAPINIHSPAHIDPGFVAAACQSLIATLKDGGVVAVDHRSRRAQGGKESNSTMENFIWGADQPEALRDNQCTVGSYGVNHPKLMILRIDTDIGIDQIIEAVQVQDFVGSLLPMDLVQHRLVLIANGV